MFKQFLEAGKIVGTHGVHGELRVNPWCDSAEFLKQFHILYFDDKGDMPIKVISSRTQKKQLFLLLEGIDTVEEADACHGKILYLDRKDAHIPQGRYFIQDLIGLEVYDADTFVYYGTLTDVLRTGANDVYQVTSLDRKNYLVPAIDSIIRTIDLGKGKMLIRPIKGIFDDAD